MDNNKKKPSYLAPALPLDVEAEGCSRKSRRIRLKSLGSSCCGKCPVLGITFTVAFSPSFLHIHTCQFSCDPNVQKRREYLALTDWLLKKWTTEIQL